MLIDKQRIKSAFTKAIPTYEHEAYIQQQIAKKLYKSLSAYIKRPVSSILEIGCGTGFLTRFLCTHFYPEIITANDLCPEVISHIPDGIKFIPGDMESIVFPEKYDLITGSSSIQWLTDLPLFLKKIDQNLAEKGLLAISTFGEKNFMEIREITGTGLSYYKKSDLEQIFSSTFHIIEIKEDIKTLYFSSPKDILLHMKQSGINGIVANRWTKADLMNFTNQYSKLFNSNNGLSLTYHPIYIIAQKRKNK